MADQLNLTDKQKQAMKLMLEEHRAKREAFCRTLPELASRTGKGGKSFSKSTRRSCANWVRTAQRS